MAVSRKPIIIPIALLAALAAGWSAYWHVGSRITAQGVANWMEREAEHGRKWTCRDQKIGGYPFRFELRCAAVSVDGSQARQPFFAEAGELRAVALAYRFNHIIAELDGPAAVTAPNGEQFAATWDKLRTSTIVRGGRVDAYDSAVSNLRIGRLDGGGQTPVLTATEIETHLRATPGAAEPMLDLVVDGKSLASTQLDQMLGGEGAGDLALRATLTRADAIGPGAPIDNLERWRAAGGKATIAQFKVNRGTVALDVTGELSIDEERKLAGRIEGTAAGLEQLLGRGGGILGGLISWRTRNDTQPRALPVALTLKDGRVMMGPVRLVNLAPLY